MISLSHHAAYPYVFNHDGVFYCVPETGPRNQVALYEAPTPLGPWTMRNVLLGGVGARDSTVFQFSDRWWLFCTVADADPRTQQTNLHNDHPTRSGSVRTG